MRGTVTNIFISYSRKDSKELALRLRDDLQATGFSVWLDLSEISGGSTWTRDIQNAIEHCHVALLLLSPGERDSHWCLS
ncbi:MAG: toll/interleukin-1 receptor domain-containing protein, partial [Anaerolineae bacterium]|nr:toll/interleukin-1 receptor domain-containing protein [Anaerolineae bacterium]